MIKSHRNIFTGHRALSRLLALSALGAMIAGFPAAADQPEAQTALSRAEAKIEMATRQAGLAGNEGDQSFNMARQRLDMAREALKADKYDSATMFADEASVLAELTGEKAKLAALQTSHDAVAKAAISPARPL